MKEKITDYALISVGILSTVILLYLFAKTLLPVIFPFILAWLIAALTVSPAQKLSAKIKLPERILRLILSLAVTLLFFTGLGFLIKKGVVAIWNFLSDFGEGNRLYDMLSGLFSSDAPLFGKFLPEGIAAKISTALGEVISTFLTKLAEGITSIGLMLPQAFLFIVVTLISLVYFALDYDKIIAFSESVLPEKLMSALGRIKNGTLFAIRKYILSYSLILIITYAVLLIGFLLLKVEHASVLALFVSLLDILPIIGVGTVLIPWSIFEFVMGNSILGIGLLVLFVVYSVIREFSEPKIVGKSLDLHPIITLMMIYIGYALFGILGMLLLPIAAVSLTTAIEQ